MRNYWKEVPDERPTFETLQWQLDDYFIEHQYYNSYIKMKYYLIDTTISLVPTSLFPFLFHHSKAVCKQDYTTI